MERSGERPRAQTGYFLRAALRAVFFTGRFAVFFAAFLAAFFTGRFTAFFAAFLAGRLAFFADFFAAFLAAFLATFGAGFFATFFATFLAAFFGLALALGLAPAFFRGFAAFLGAGAGGSTGGGGGGRGEAEGMGSIHPEPDQPISKSRNSAMLASSREQMRRFPPHGMALSAPWRGMPYILHNFRGCASGGTPRNLLRGPLPFDTMRALTLTRFGGVESLAVQDVPRPELGSSMDVRVGIRTAALNHIDLFVMAGLPGAEYAFPHVMGADGAGIVESVGASVTRVRPGDRVVLNPGISCGRCAPCQADEGPFCRQYSILGEHREGTYAEYVVVPESNVSRIGDRLTWPEAAALPLAGLTAWRMLMTRAAVRAGETVLIWGAGGGVSLAALQIAKLAGADVVVTSGDPRKLELARSLGADLALDHHTMDVVREVRNRTGVGADIVVDSVGAATWSRSLRALRPGGRLVTCGATTGPDVALDLRKLFWFQWSLLGSTMGNHREFAAMLQSAEDGRLRPVVDQVVPLAESVTAFSRLAAGQQLGKIVIEVTP